MYKEYKLKTKKAFTLSELLVTLCMMGVLGAVIIPLITKINPSPSKMMFKKEYSVLEKAVSKMINDDLIYPGNEIDSGTGLPRGFNYGDDNSGKSSGLNKFCYYLADNLNTLGPSTCPTPANTSNPGILFAKTTDGADWYISPRLYPTDHFPLTGETYNTKIIIDVNGSKNGPNCSSDINSDDNFLPTSPTNFQANSGDTTKCPKPDIFIIGVRYDGHLRPGISWSPATGTPLVTDQTAVDYLSAPMNNKK